MSATDDDKAPLWKYVRKIEKIQETGGNWKWECSYCHDELQGSYTRVRAHLLQKPNAGIRMCDNVKPEHAEEMQKLCDQAMLRLQAKKSKGVSLPTLTFTKTEVAKKRKGEGGRTIQESFNQGARDHLHSLIARMFYSAGLPFHLARNPYFIKSYTFAATNMISGYRPPGYNLLRTRLLQSEKAHIDNLLDPIKATWKRKGVTIVSDGWSDSQRRPIINVMAVTGVGPMFLNAVNAEGMTKDKDYISKILINAIEEVGPENVVQVVTDNAAVCKAAGGTIEDKYPHIFWTPCVVHTLNLALKNICAAKNTEANEVVYDACSWISVIIVDAMVIKNFIMNHSMRLAMFNRHVNLKLLAIAETRFASAIVMLRRFKEIKRGLIDMVISEGWSAYRSDDVGKAQFVREKILDELWWDKIEYIISFSEPIYNMLRSADTDKPNLHLLYEIWDTMIEEVKCAIYKKEGKRDNEESSFFDVVHTILVARWTKSNTPLHCMAHSLNPRYYSENWLTKSPNRSAPNDDNEISTERGMCLRRYFPNDVDRRKVNSEYAKFSGSLGAFADSDSLNDRGLMDPMEWWIVHGSSTPILQALASKLLGHPSSSSCCERNWSTYKFIHSIKRNKMTPQRAEDLVFVHTNHRLLSRRAPEYLEGETKMWDVGGDEYDTFDGAGMLELANLSLDEPALESVIFGDDMGDEVGPIGSASK